jgi:peptidyl-prolyl cis-trans isomerase SurA
MNFSIIVYFLLIIAPNNSKDVLFSINDNDVTTEEFIRVYNKNIDLLTDKSQKNIDNYLQLYIDYKLKVLEAYNKNYNKNKSYISELNKYSSQLATKYLIDIDSQDSLVLEAYKRTKTEINASHILIKLDENSTDTLGVYNKLLNYRNELKNNNFDFMKKKYHNGVNVFVEDLGYFSAFKMIYTFESMAYKTSIGDVSMPFRTRFGFHILKINDQRKSLGQITVGHIMLLKKHKDSKLKINTIYDSISKGANFEKFAKKYSDDKNTSNIGGKLKPFTSGQLNSLAFENAAFGLKEIGQISNPIETKFGWHILKLYDKSKLASFSEMKPLLLKKVKNNSRSSVISNSFYNKLLKKYAITYESDLTYFQNELNKIKPKKAWIIPEDIEKNKILFSINNIDINYSDFANYIVDFGLKNQHDYKNIKDLYKLFINKSLMNYYRENLISENKEYKNIYNEYKDGLLLFDLLENEVWNKAKKDTLALKKYYTDNRSSFTNIKKPFNSYNDIPTEVISNFQKLFEEKWIDSLRNSSKIIINKKELKKIKKKINK